MNRAADISGGLLRPCLFGPARHWALRAAGWTVDRTELFDKRRKEMHRYTIADVNGPLTLTVPVVKPHGVPRATWADVALSDHGEWWHVHRTALESAYGRTPFFEFYIDRFAPFVSREAPELFPSVAAYVEAADRVVADLLLLPDHPSATEAVSSHFEEEPYWQPRQAQLGFLPGLSILDLLFCLGPESALYIRSPRETVEPCGKAVPPAVLIDKNQESE